MMSYVHLLTMSECTSDCTSDKFGGKIMAFVGTGLSLFVIQLRLGSQQHETDQRNKI